MFCPGKRGLMQPMRRCLWLAAVLALGVNAAAAQDSSCRNTAGPERSAGYVRQCLEVTPAMHPPCNAQNPCELIIGEIARGCRLIRGDLVVHQPNGARPLACASPPGAPLISAIGAEPAPALIPRLLESRIAQHHRG